jgi:hypothetical protein
MLNTTRQLQLFNAQQYTLFTMHWLFTIFQKLPPDSAIICTTITPKIPLPPGRRHAVTITVQTCLPPGFRLAQNIAFNPHCLEHSGTFKGFPLADEMLPQHMVALYTRMSMAKANHCYALWPSHLLFVIYFISPSRCPNINLTLSWPTREWGSSLKSPSRYQCLISGFVCIRNRNIFQQSPALMNLRLPMHTYSYY